MTFKGKLLVLLMFGLLSVSTLQAQKISVKDGVVFVDGEKCLLSERDDATSISFSTLEGDEIIYLKFIHNSRYAKLYTKVTFLDQGRAFTSTYGYTRKILIKKLIKDGTLTNCQLDPEKVEKFILKNDENVEYY